MTDEALRRAAVLSHRLSNELALTLGLCELIARHSDLPVSLRPLADDAFAGAQEAMATLRELGQVTRASA